MKKMINNLVYNTDTAKCYGEISRDMGEYQYTERLYRKRTGEYFLHCVGNSASPYSNRKGRGRKTPYTKGERIVPLSYMKALKWGKNNMPEGEYKAVFDLVVSEGTERLCFTVDRKCSSKLRQYACENGLSLREALESVVDTYVKVKAIDNYTSAKT